MNLPKTLLSAEWIQDESYFTINLLGMYYYYVVAFYDRKAKRQFWPKIKMTLHSV